MSESPGDGAESSARIVRCPSCGGRSLYAASNPTRPFCSERCRNADFGTWAAENYRMAARADPEVDGDPDGRADD